MATMEPFTLLFLQYQETSGGRDILENIGAVLTTNGSIFFGDFQVHENAGLGNCNPMHK